MINKFKFIIKKLKKNNNNIILNNVLLYNPFLRKEISKTKIYREESKKEIRKYLFCKTFFKPITLFYFKKLLLSIKFFYTDKFSINLKKSKKNQKKNLNIEKLTKKENKLIKILFFLIKKKQTKTKFFILIQKKLISFLLKKNIHQNKLSPFYYHIKKFFLSFLNQKLASNRKMLRAYYIMGVLKRFEKGSLQDNIKLYNKLLGLLTKKGNKVKAKTILNKALSRASKECKCTPNLLLKKIISKLKTSVEAKKIRVRRSFHFVPFPLKKERKFFMISKWLLLGAKHQVTEKGFENKLSLELVELIKDRKSFAYKFRRRNISKSLQNKANSHFRW